jgi:hypothetical protein
VLGRRKFGSQGWSKSYNFNDGDLAICADVLNNYLEKYDEVPYDTYGTSMERSCTEAISLTTGTDAPATPTSRSSSDLSYCKA